MRINLETRRPVLGHKTGGLSGPAIKPIAVRLVWELYQNTDKPILGMGGVRTVKDALELALAGARLVAVGTATFADPYAPIKLVEGLDHFFAGRDDAWLD